MFHVFDDWATSRSAENGETCSNFFIFYGAKFPFIFEFVLTEYEWMKKRRFYALQNSFRITRSEG